MAFSYPPTYNHLRHGSASANINSPLKSDKTLNIFQHRSLASFSSLLIALPNRFLATILHITFSTVYPNHLSVSTNTLLFLPKSLYISFIESFTSASRICLNVSRRWFERTSSVAIFLTWHQKGP